MFDGIDRQSGKLDHDGINTSYKERIDAEPPDKNTGDLPGGIVLNGKGAKYR